MSMTMRKRQQVVALIGLIALAACAAGQPTRFYTLSPAQDAQIPVAAQEGLSVGVGAVNLPAYLDRSQIVTRAGPNRIDVAELDSWIEPLASMFPRVLAENLGRSLETDAILLLPARRAVRVDYQVEVEVLRFDAEPSGDAVLDARWRVLDRNERLIAGNRSTITERAGEPADYGAIVAAMSRALGDLSRDIAAAIASSGA